jgi:hypothetical protein
MSSVIPYRPRSSDHVVIEQLMVRKDDGSLVRRYFVSPFLDGAYCFGECDSSDLAEALVAASEYGLPIVKKLGGLS